MSCIAMEEFELMKDSKYRMFTGAVDKALKNFEYTSEWADLISALGKLNKVLSSYQKYQIIPRRIKISKRLAQCMHPALPSGVHLKALETYDIIFKCMGTNRLSQELFIYSAGLFPLLGHAAMNIRPTLLTVYETHFVPLRERLRPALSGFLSGILPGLELGSDHYDRTYALLDNVCDGVGVSWFYTCMWQCVRSNSPVRLPAISYVLAHYSRKLPMEDQLHLMGNDIDVMVSGLCAAVQDSSVLVQRSALDLLMVCFPMQNTQLLYADMVRLVTAALTTILRRDMSLNRRLYAWLLNSEVKSNQMQMDQLLEEYGPVVEENPNSPTIAYDLLTEAIRITLKQSSADTNLDIRPYRLLTSLFDKRRIGTVILDNILYDVFRALYFTCLNQQKHKNSSARCVSFNGDLTSLKNEENVLTKDFLTKYCQDLIKNANMLFNILQSHYIWSYIEKLYEKSIGNSKTTMRDRYQVNEIGSGEPSLLEICILTEFLLDIIPIETYVKSTLDILPNLFKKIVNVLRKNISTLNRFEVTHSLQLSKKILLRIQPVTVKHVDSIHCSEEKAINKLVDSGEKEVDEEVDSVEIKLGVEKSKSDSKINEKLNKNELTIEDISRERSNSNQMIVKKKDKKDSPKIDKKSKNKKSKSSSKLYDLKREDEDVDSVCNVSPVKVETEVVQEKVEATCSSNGMRIENKHILSCLRIYKQFYVSLVESRIIPDVNIEKFFNSLVHDKEVRIKKLESLLESCLLGDNACRRTSDHESSKVADTSAIVSSHGFDDAMSVASDLLVEFAAFPNILHEEHDKEMPYWLKVLIIACCSPRSNCDVQITAMNTLMEIMSLAKSQDFKPGSKSNNNVVVMGILDNAYVDFIENSTVVLEAICQILWDLLGVLSNQSQITLCVSLLYNIHNVFENKQFVEQIVGKYLIDENVSTDYFKRFYLLWNLGRDLNVKQMINRSTRNFDRSLLKILDNLNNTERSNLRLLAETFVTHSLLRHDIARIVNPILSMLLVPSTARISIRHVHIQDGDANADLSNADSRKLDDAKAKKIYAISNVNGNVMFHITDDPSPKPPKKRWFLFSKAGKKYTQAVNMTTSLAENLNIVTKMTKDFKTESAPPNVERTSKNNVKLFVNPLSSKEIYPTGAEGCYTKIDPHQQSQRSSNESLSDIAYASLGNGADSGFESQPASQARSSLSNESGKTRASFLLERIEPISEGIRDATAAKPIPKSRSFDEKSTSNVEVENNLSLVHSWSYSMSDGDNLNAELELSTAAEEYFKDPHVGIAAEVINELLDRVCGKEEVKPKIVESVAKNFTLYPMHYHICLYYEVFDSDRILYSLRTLRNCLRSNPLLFIRCLATAGLKDLRGNELLHLMARHRKSILGSGFCGELSPELVNTYRGYTFLDVIITICLNFARTYYPSLDDNKLTKEEIENNLQIQLNSLEILNCIVKHLNNLVDENFKGFSGYIADMLMKCNLQKILLHCLLTSVKNFDEDMTFSDEVLLYNNFKLYDNNKRVSEHVEAYQINLLRLIHSLIILENKLFKQQKDVNPSSPTSGVGTSMISGEHLTYAPTILIPQQSMFLSAILSALRHQNMKSLHQNWCNMVTSCLPYFGDNLKDISMSVVHQICFNLEKLADAYKAKDLGGELCADYATTQLESLTILVHYCLLDSTQTANQNLPVNSTQNTNNTSEILNNLVSAFFSPNGDLSKNNDNYLNARKCILSHMPKIISSVAKLWQTIVGIEGDYCGIFGHSKVVKQQLLEFLSPIAVHHSSSFLAAVAVAWHERRNPFTNVKTVLPEPNASQNNLVILILAIRVIPLDNLVQTVTAVIKNPPPIQGLTADICLDVSVLELFYCYMRNASATQLSEAWSSLLALVREGCSLTPPAQFLLAALLHELMIKCCPLEERKDQKDLQDVTAKLIECVSQVCGSCLEQTTWLRRNLAVKEQDEESISSISVVSCSNSDILTGINNSYSVQAQLVLSEILAQILDICFGSVEKDKVNTILTSLMCNIVPYLRTHTYRNMHSFVACSKLMASLSSYQYTRKAWKKDVFDLLLDNTLFQMDYSCLKYWKIIIDNLMTHDNTTFRDLMSRVSMAQTGGLNLFTTREQEYEQRAQLLKRLAFVIFCSETDQYAKYMPDIQEQLTTSLRLSVPGVQAQVFMCFRVLLIRMSPINMTSLWPIIISEMLQVFIQIEQELSTETEEFSSHIRLMVALDASWTLNSNNGLHALGHPHWRSLQLATAKLLDLALLLPATSLPQFQMYRWAFVGDDLPHAQSSYNMLEMTSFTPHVCRIASLMDQRYSETQIETLPTKQNELLLTMNSIEHLKDLHGFFKTLSLCSNRHRTECNGSVSNDFFTPDKPTDRKTLAILEKLDRIVEMDFLDKITR
ncbi:PREDICTED: protein dopey-1 homolog isoform X2 [Nicrophorus vespilloides]|uniref:Protein dopey-1 homolog isoform X2 n=1 Tax=Nicrophorus vespilloides TaxID=110193 RepID=A0ABM1ME66_NICVS|nr:PREDICTED: protein dopey-1 homolog isoform X2 [Nicrophorus vespilloides]